MINHLRNQGGQIMLTGVGGDDMMLGSPLIYGDKIRRGNFLALGQLWRDARFNHESFPRILYTWFLKPKLSGPLRRWVSRRRQSQEWPAPPWIREDFAARTNLKEKLSFDPPHRPWSWAKQADYKRIIQTETDFQQTAHWLNRLAARQKVEYRHPFFDRRISEFILSVPSEQLWQKGFSKHLLRRSMTGLLPESIRLRPDKSYYYDVFQHCLRVEDAVHISRLLEKPLTAKLGFIDEQKVQEIWQAYQGGRIDNKTTHGLMQLVSLEYWLNYYYDKLYS
jgi:asparagine synthase (glutamine-hydrolysing)